MELFVLPGGPFFLLQVRLSSAKTGCLLEKNERVMITW